VDPNALQRQWRNPQRTNFQAFVPHSPRGFEHWTKPPWQEATVDHYPDIGSTALAPAPHEAYGVIRGAGGMIGQWGSSAMSAPAMMAGNIAKILGPFLDYVSGGKFTPAFNRAEGQSLAKQKFMLSQQREYFEMERERMMDATDQAVRVHRQSIGEAQEILEEYRDQAIDEPTARQRLVEWAQKNGDDKLISVIANGGLKAAENWLSWRDAKINDMAASSRSLRASDARRKEAAAAKGQATDLDKAWSAGGEGGAQEGLDASGRRILPGATRGEETPPAEPEEEAMSDVDKEIAKKRGLSVAGMTAAHQILRGGAAEGTTRTNMRTLAPKKYGDVITASGDLDRAVRTAAAGPGTPDEKIEAIRQVDPAVATTLDGLRKYEVDPVSLRANQARDTAIARQVDPNYNPSFFKQAQKYRDPNTKEGSIIQRTATIPTSYMALLRALRPLKENDPNLKRVIEQVTSDFWTGDPRYAEVHQAIRNYLTDVVGVQMGTGTPRVTLIAEGAKHLKSTSSPAQIRQQALVDLIPTFGMINQINRQWQRETKSNTNAPLYDEENAKIMDGMVRMNGYTGEIPSDAPDVLRSVSKPAPTGKDRPRWMTDAMIQPPLNRADVDYWRGWLEKNPNHPDAQAIREQLGIIPDLRPRY